MSYPLNLPLRSLVTLLKSVLQDNFVIVKELKGEYLKQCGRLLLVKIVSQYVNLKENSYIIIIVCGKNSRSITNQLF